MVDLKYTEILQLNQRLSESMQGEGYKLVILSNIITSQLHEIFEYALRSENINASVISGDYDNILQDAVKYKNAEIVVVFWEAANLIDGFQYKANLMEETDFENFITKCRSEIDFLLTSLQGSSLVLFNKFTSLAFNHDNIKSNQFDRVCKELNNYLEQKSNSNILLIDIEKIFAKVSIKKSVDFRYYYSSKALYTIDFYKSWSQYVTPVIKSLKGLSKKALIFDCDNTLWKGIIGEDGMENIHMSSKTKNGVVFEEIQNMAVELSRKGILIGLCSKNNLQDVENVLQQHPDMSLRDKYISIKKVNWEDKVTNLQNIANELNIGIDSLVFVDDSDFELGFIKNNLPGVETIRVPSNLYEYPQIIRDKLSLFYTISESEEDLKRVDMYKQQQQRANEKVAFDNLEKYLTSLELKINVHINEVKVVPRVSQLTQKTNQFNLTTRRYSESDIENFYKNGNDIVLSFEVSDKYGESGITGVSVLVIDKNNNAAEIDSLLMSCRILGRNIEIAFFDFLVRHLKRIGINTVYAKYLRTAKNEQVSEFYETVGFTCISSAEKEKLYVLKLADYVDKNINYINIYNGREN